MDDKKIIATIEKVMPSVVSITISKHLEDIEKNIPAELWAQLPHVHEGGQSHLPKELADERGMVQVGGGSGFIVSPDGLIITNKHVIMEPDAEYTVITNDGKKHKSKVLSRDPMNDVAILKIDSAQLPAVALGDAAALKLGQSVLAIGNALGLFRNTVSSGIVSGLSRAIRAQADPDAPPQEMRGLIQTDAAINPGNSGGPLVNLKGEAVGINVATVFGAQNIGFAIPMSAAKRDLHDLKQYGRIRRPFLGVRYIVIDETLKSRMKLPVSYGALIVHEGPLDEAVAKGSPAEKAGLQEMDIVLEFNEHKIDRDHPIQDFLEEAKVGEVCSLKVLRKGKSHSLTLSLTERR